MQIPEIELPTEWKMRYVQKRPPKTDFQRQVEAAVTGSGEIRDPQVYIGSPRTESELLSGHRLPTTIIPRNPYVEAWPGSEAGYIPLNIRLRFPNMSEAEIVQEGQRLAAEQQQAEDMFILMETLRTMDVRDGKAPRRFRNAYGDVRTVL